MKLHLKLKGLHFKFILVMNQLVILATFISSVYSTSSCPDNCLVTTPDGTTYDLSALKGIEISQTIVNSGLSSTYSFNLCGQDTQTCPEDKSAPPVISGMAVQKQDGGCFVLGVYNEQEQSSACSWSNTAGYPLSLTMISGSSEFCQGSPRALEIGFTCADTLIPKTWTASNPGEGVRSNTSNTITNGEYHVDSPNSCFSDPIYICSSWF